MIATKTFVSINMKTELMSTGGTVVGVRKDVVSEKTFLSQEVI